MFRRHSSTKSRLDYRDGALIVTMRELRRQIPGAAVTDIIECAMADPINHGEEEFHIVVTAGEIVVAGPFVLGSVEAIAALSKDRPDIHRTQRRLLNIPFRFRGSGLSCLFPIAGLHVAPRTALSAFPLED